jgi:hypothetical protein
MPQRHSGRHLVYILTARSGGSREGFFHIDIADAKPLHSLE